MGNEESRRVRNEEPREEDHRDEVEREEGAQEEDIWEEQTDESAEEKARREAHNQEVYARRACLNYAEYQMFQRREQERAEGDTVTTWRRKPLSL